MEHFYESVPGNCHSIPELYKGVIESVKDGAVIVELGVFGGKSFAYLAVEAVNSGKRIDLYGVDLWEHAAQILRNATIPYEPFPMRECIRNLSPLGDWSAHDKDMYYCSRGMTHMTLRRNHSHIPLMDKESCDLVFIDADHSYDGVKRDIRGWKDRVKRGGILAGHDYSPEYDGVRRAVNELLGKDNIEQRGIVWVYKV